MQLPGNKVELIESYGGTLKSFQCASLIYKLNKKGIDGSHPCLGLAEISRAWPITPEGQKVAQSCLCQLLGRRTIARGQQGPGSQPYAQAPGSL
ncbi:hypothetical protein EJ02DRAFT_128122 [Clathrospora elynae]|uniref:Uncharacterized protein n=1 Tax=Clathrospora elynae TaxID=706981 RepID=A0A6A5S656_9PLEO|nr:hypothetical protein EJ02DRAFT_128122 [Clathrospora elynae]